MTLIDVFLYNGEPIVEARLKYLDSIVDRFVVIESDQTFSGKPKAKLSGLALLDNPKVKLVVFSPQQGHPDAWSREHAQRSTYPRAEDLGELPTDTLFHVSDVDEIPSVTALTTLKRAWLGGVAEEPAFVRLEQEFFYYNLCWRKPQRWTNAFVANAAWFGCGYSAQDGRQSNGPVKPRGGWHLSYFDTYEGIKAKVEAFSHQEFNIPGFKARDHVEQCLAEGTDLFQRPGEDCIFNAEPDDVPSDFVEFHNRLVTQQVPK